MELEAMFDLENCPTAQSTRLRYYYSDHFTSFVRAKAWFQQWPRSGLQLDNFLGTGPFKPMDASHTCHQNCCIAHIAYEPTNTNHDRKACCELAARLRQEGKPIPEHCEAHNPPCLLQHAALTTQEAYAIQFDVLRRARGLAPKSIDRPRRHRFSSFESQLPCRFSAIKVEPADLVLERPAPTNPNKPQLLCIFCKKLKNLQTVTGLWGHIVHKHDGIDVEDRLREIRRTAGLWRTYWDEHVDGGKGGSATVKRLEEAAKDDFNWDTVLSWRLR